MKPAREVIRLFRRGARRGPRRYLDMVLPSRTHGNVYVAAIRRRVDRDDAAPGAPQQRRRASDAYA